MSDQEYELSPARDLWSLVKIIFVLGFGIAFIVFMVTLGCLAAYWLVEAVR